MSQHTVKLTIAYDGTNYNGWQLQKNPNTIQGKIEKAIQKVYGQKCRLYSASRTDAGVHAKGQAAHFVTSIKIPSDKIPKAINSYLPPDIVIKKAVYEKNSFNARFDAVSKMYRYFIFNSHARDPFKERYAWRVTYKLDFQAMKKEARLLKGRHNFKSLQAKDKKERNSVRTIKNVTLAKKGSMIKIDIEADGFLYNMARNIAGTLVDIGRGYLPSGSMAKILKAKKREAAGSTAPGKGLTLIEVKY